MTVLENGIHFAFRRSSSPVAYIALSIKSGTRDEGRFPAGLAHFTEHLIFKGTSRRTSSVINSCLERLGGELNAFTSKEETVIHATVLKEYLNTAADLLFDITFNSVFPEKEIEKERTVIIEEINSYKDSPADQIFDDFEEMLFSGTPLATPVLGKAASLKRIRREDILSYWKARFVPSNICVTVCADMEEKKALSIIGRAASKNLRVTKKGTWSPSMNFIPPPNLPEGRLLSLRSDIFIAPADFLAGPSSFGKPSRSPIAPEGLSPFRHENSHRHHQAHCIIGAPAFSLYSRERMPLILLTNYLGGPAANSTLNLILRERNALVYGVEAAFTQYEETGLFTVYFGCDKEHLERCKTLVLKELSRVRECLPGPTVLKMAKKQLLGQLAISSDNGEAQVLAMGKNLMVYGNIPDPEQIRARIEAVTAEEVRDAARSILDPARLSILTYR